MTFGPDPTSVPTDLTNPPASKLGPSVAQLLSELEDTIQENEKEVRVIATRVLAGEEELEAKLEPEIALPPLQQQIRRVTQASVRVQRILHLIDAAVGSPSDAF